MQAPITYPSSSSDCLLSLLLLFYLFPQAACPHVYSLPFHSNVRESYPPARRPCCHALSWLVKPWELFRAGRLTAVDVINSYPVPGRCWSNIFFLLVPESALAAVDWSESRIAVVFRHTGSSLKAFPIARVFFFAFLSLSLFISLLCFLFFFLPFSVSYLINMSVFRPRFTFCQFHCCTTSLHFLKIKIHLHEL